MEEDVPFICHVKAFLFNIIGPVFFILDLVLDVLAVKNFYQEEAYIAMGVLLFLLLGSSVLVHTFSWFCNDYEVERNGLGKYEYLEKYLTKRSLAAVLHVCQLAIFFRFASVMEISLRSRHSASKEKTGIAAHLSHDLRLLCLIETFSENAPQLTLMLTVIVESKHVELVTGFKALASSVGIAISMLTYHRFMRSFSTDKAKMTWISSIVFFLWNFLLIVPRVAAVALCASALPAGMIAVHFILLWLPLFYWAWRQKTDFMDTSAGEWLYRATVALIWYFSWFNVSKGNSMQRSIIYHLFIAVDIIVLMVLWWWWRCAQDAFISGLPAMWVFIFVGLFYILGIAVKTLYYKRCHPKKADTEAPAPAVMWDEELGVVLAPPPSQVPLTGAQKRMNRLAEHFYS